MTLPNINLTTLSENASRLGMRLHESISERTREFTLQNRGIESITTMGMGIGGSFDSLNENGTGTGTIKKNLESGNEREKLDAMRKIIALIPKFPATSPHPHFASVVKLVSSPNIEIRKLVYVYLLQYSAYQPDLALLAVNGLKREMAGEHVGAAAAAAGNGSGSGGGGGSGGFGAAVVMRGWAVRVLCGMALGVRGRMMGGDVGEGGGGGGLAPLVRLAIAKCVKDGNVYVRKVGALALIKCYELDPSHPSNLTTLSTYLSDPSPLVLGSVLYTFTQISPTRYDLLHQQFRRICKLLVEMDEWGQSVCVDVLARYGRVMLPRPVWAEGKGEEEGEEEEDKDLKLLIDSVKPLLQSRNPAVVVAAMHVLYYLGPPSYWPLFVPHLLRLLNVSREVERVVLGDLLIISKKDPDLLAPHYTRFLVRCDDLREVKKDKIRLMLNVVNEENWAAILREFIDYAEDTDDFAVEEAIGGIGKVGMRVSQGECMSQCLTSLIMMIKSRYDGVVSSAVMVLQRLVQIQLGSGTRRVRTGHSPVEIVEHLARRIDDIKHPKARACVVWLVGQYAGVVEEGKMVEFAPDVLRKVAKTFMGESRLVKLQAVNLAGKLIVLCGEEGGEGEVERKVGELGRYVFSLARYDGDWDVRDRGRFVGGLVEGKGERGGVVLRREQVRVVLFEGKEVVEEEEEEEKGELLPDWMERGVESILREVQQEEETESETETEDLDSFYSSDSST